MEIKLAIVIGTVLLIAGCATQDLNEMNDTYFESFCVAHQKYIGEVSECATGKVHDEKDGGEFDFSSAIDDCYARLTHGEHMSVLHLEFAEKEKQLREKYKCKKAM